MYNNRNIWFFAIVSAVVLNVFSWHLPFFWDTILTSTITQHFFEHGFCGLIPPAQLDAGHPPLFYFYVTCFYHLFGKSLMAAHLSMLPFTILGIAAFIHLLQHFTFSKNQQITGVFLFFSVPAVLTQYTLVSYDAVLLSLYLATLVAYFKNKKNVFSILIFGMLGITLRGLFGVVSLSIIIYFLERKNIKTWFSWNLLFVPALLFISGWYGYHYSQTGWLFATKAEGWRSQRGWTDMIGIFKNGISIARCFFDLGIVLLSFFSIIYFFKSKKIDNYTLLWLIPAIVFSLSFLPFTNPINHRYYLIVYVLMLLPVIKFLADIKIRYTILTICILLLGHLQIYPVPISNGWDCTLVHSIYSTERKNFWNAIDNRFHLRRDSMGTVFPMNTSLYQTDMTADTVRMINVNGASIDSIEYVLYSNIGNDFSDEQIAQLKGWFPFIEYHRFRIDIIAYRNPKFHSK